MSITIDQLNKVFAKEARKKNISGASIRIEALEQQFSWSQSTGALKGDKPFAIASITKMMTTAIVLNLVHEGKLSLEKTFGDYINRGRLKGFQIFAGDNFLKSLRIRQLLSHTSGLPDYYTEKSKAYKDFASEILNKDKEITLEEILERTSHLKPHLINGRGSKAHYSDCNFELLGYLLTLITEKSLESLFQEYIIHPLGLKKTRVCTHNSEFESIMWGAHKLSRPLAISSQLASGGIISTTKDLMVFLKAFYSGKLFPRDYIRDLEWKKIQWYPLEYSMGMMRCELPRMLSPFIPAPKILGHSGSIGSFAFYCPSKKVHIVGTMNQVKYNPFPLMYKLLNCI